MTRLADPANRTAQPNAGPLARHHRRARRAARLDPAAALLVVLIATSTVAGIARGTPIATGVTLLALLPAAIVDLQTRRLPNPALLAAATAGVVAGVVERSVGSRLDDVGVIDVALGVLVVTAPLLILHLASPASMGFGDVKLGIVLGLALAPLDPIAGFIALAAGGAAGVLGALVTRQRAIPFGPALLGGAALATVITPSVVAQ